MNLFLAVCAEHKQRTGHDIFTQGKMNTTATLCDVCLHLHAVKREMEEEERIYHEKMQLENK